MPVSISELIRKSGISVEGIETVRWNNRPKNSEVGIYIVSTCQNPNLNCNLYSTAPIDDNVLNFWLNKVSALQIDYELAPTMVQVRDRLTQFWLPDENILYIGMTNSKKGIAGRVGQYYRTEIGERRPHAGGHWIKTLKILSNLYIHYFPDKTPKQTEEKLLRTFIEQVSKKNTQKLKRQKPTSAFC